MANNDMEILIAKLAKTEKRQAETLAATTAQIAALKKLAAGQK